MGKGITFDSACDHAWEPESKDGLARYRCSKCNCYGWKNPHKNGDRIRIRPLRCRQPGCKKPAMHDIQEHQEEHKLCDEHFKEYPR